MRARLVLAAAAALAAVPADRTARIPFTWTPGQIEVAVRVNDRPATFLLDTGAEYSTISARLAAAIGAATDRSAGRDFASDVALRVGTVTLPHQRVMVLPFDTYYARGRNIDGLLGYDVFARFVVRIDVDGRVLELWAPSALKPPRAAVSVPLAMAGRLPVVESTIEIEGGRVPARLMVDTGASQAVILRYPFAQEHGLLDRAAQRAAALTGAPSLASGDLALVDVPVERVAIAGWTFDRPHVQAHREPSGSGAAAETDGLIGNELLSRFRMTVDYPRRRLLLEPRQHAQP